MAFPTPSDLLWVTGFPVQGCWLTPLLREAVRTEWPHAVELARSQLGEDSNARELMEIAIAQAQEILVDQPEASLEEVRRTLMRCYRNALRRTHRHQTKLKLWGSSGDLDRISKPVATEPSQVEARLDLEVLLRDTPEDIRHALLSRYGAHSSWEDVATEATSTKDGIRMRCQRELSRIARHFGITKQKGRRETDSRDRRSDV